MTFNVALSVVIYIILATGFNAERQCGDNGGKKILVNGDPAQSH